MIEKIIDNPVLQPFLSKTCCENNICITFATDVSPDDYIVIKVDEYYNSLPFSNQGDDKTPPSPDCLIIRRCKEGGFGLVIGELKNISSSKDFKTANLIAKFSTCFDDFMQNRFADLLFVDYKSIKLYFVSNIDKYKPNTSLSFEVLQEVKFKYNGKNYMISPEMPQPTIKNCY